MVDKLQAQPNQNIMMQAIQWQITQIQQVMENFYEWVCSLEATASLQQASTSKSKAKSKKQKRGQEAERGKRIILIQRREKGRRGEFIKLFSRQKWWWWPTLQQEQEEEESVKERQ